MPQGMEQVDLFNVVDSRIVIHILQKRIAVVGKFIRILIDSISIVSILKFNFISSHM